MEMAQPVSNLLNKNMESQDREMQEGKKKHKTGIVKISGKQNRGKTNIINNLVGAEISSNKSKE